jgi:AcrR family transcriptional regulator
MATQAAPKAPSATDTRQRLLDAAIRLFTKHGFAGTSLQMIADELGITKAAVYHYFRTREDLLTAVVEPLRAQLQGIVETAEAQRTPRARAEHMLIGYADLAVRNRALMSVLAGDPSVFEMLRTHADMGELVARQIKLLADVDPGPVGLVNSAMLFGGIAGAVRPELINLDDQVLRQQLIETGRRIIGLRPPRRPSAEQATTAPPPSDG